MRKRIIDDHPPAAEPGWLDLERVAEVEISSEEPDHPVESALIPDAAGAGWRAAQPGTQVLRLRFDAPQRLRRIHLLFEEGERARTQEFALRWSPDGGRSYREIVRQQYTFSVPGTTREVEDYRVELADVTVLELRIAPDVSGGDARASLACLRLA